MQQTCRHVEYEVIGAVRYRIRPGSPTGPGRYRRNPLRTVYAEFRVPFLAEAHSCGIAAQNRSLRRSGPTGAVAADSRASDGLGGTRCRLCESGSTARPSLNHGTLGADYSRDDPRTSARQEPGRWLTQATPLA
jgi:hypothetical protein